MKKSNFIFALLILLFIITSCGDYKKEYSRSEIGTSVNKSPVRGMSSTSPVDEYILNRISSLPKIKLPFGSKYLPVYKFPKQWEQLEDKSRNITPTAYDRQMTKIIRSYDTVYNAKSITLPQITKTKYANIINHDDSLFLNDIKKFKFNCDYKYKLPDFGPLECYYQSIKFPAAYNEMFDLGKRYNDYYYLEYGNLLLYNPLSKQATIINIYNCSTGNERFGSDYKWFYIDRNKKITIYNAGSGETDGYFAPSQIITVTSDGRIIINSIP